MKYPKMFSRNYSKILCSAGVLLLACGIPAGAALAAPAVTEIMYDVPGANAGHQWIEVTNTGSDSIDLTAKDMRFFDKSGAHTIQSYNGSGTLAPGALAILADKPTTFLEDHSGFSGTLFDSVVSLTANDTIGFSQNGTVLDSISYTATGAKGDGNSLHRSGTSFVIGAANPGAPGIPVASAKPSSAPAGTTNGSSNDRTGTALTEQTDPSQPAYDKGINAPASAETPAEAGAVLPVASAASAAPSLFPSGLLSSTWFAYFLGLLVFSAGSLILIRKTS